MSKTIVIYITNYNMDELEQIHNYKSIWRVMEIETKMQLTDNLELVIIELSKARRMAKAKSK